MRCYAGANVLSWRPVLIWLLSLIAVFSGCKAPVARTDSINLRIAVLGNTQPESPFTGWNDGLAGIAAHIQSENPDIVIHLGNIILGGSSSSGVRWIDCERQFSLYKSDMSVITALQYTVPGDTDILDDSLMLYQVSTGHRADYSFNIGALHCIVINNSKRENRLPGPESMRFLKSDMAENRDYSSILIFMHRPPLDKTGDSPDVKGLMALFDILNRAPVLAVVSSGDSVYYEIYRQGVRFISLPCEPYNAYVSNNFQYYMMTIHDSTLSVEVRRVEKISQR